jgi:hypothetical protein
MAQSKNLLDSNSYFRLAKSIHPLLDTVFGDENYCLYVLKELDDEFYRNKRLKNKFAWVGDDEYTANRRKRLTLSRNDIGQIKLVAGFLRQHKVENTLGISEVDIQCLAHGQVLDIPVVTDDGDMLLAAVDFDINTMKTLELMRIMLDCAHIDMAKVRQVVAFWAYECDKPGGFRGDYIRIFNENPP